ncbi:hypothetical protein V6N13_107399 [Hibiscus sabdariffa]
MLVIPRPVTEFDSAATKLQKVYKGDRTRSLADCAVVVEELCGNGNNAADVEAPAFNTANPLSCKWSSGVDLRIGCVRTVVLGLGGCGRDRTPKFESHRGSLTWDYLTQGCRLWLVIETFMIIHHMMGNDQRLS